MSIGVACVTAFVPQRWCHVKHLRSPRQMKQEPPARFDREGVHLRASAKILAHATPERAVSHRV